MWSDKYKMMYATLMQHLVPLSSSHVKIKLLELYNLHRLADGNSWKLTEAACHNTRALHTPFYYQISKNGEYSRLHLESIWKTGTTGRVQIENSYLFNTSGSNANLKNKFDVIKISKRSNRTQRHSWHIFNKVSPLFSITWRKRCYLYRTHIICKLIVKQNILGPLQWLFA